MKWALIGALTIGFTLPSLAKTYSEAEYAFPFADPLVATIAAVAKLDPTAREILTVPIRPERKGYAGLSDSLQSGAPLTLFKHSHTSAPLIMIVGGAGASGVSVTSYQLAGALYNQGFHVVTLPDPLSFQYTFNVSKSAFPGYFPADSVEYYSFLKTVLRDLEDNEGVQVKGVSLMGYSLGGLMTGFLAKIDAQEKYFNFQKIVILNPPIAIDHSVAVLDSFLTDGLHMSAARQDWVTGLVLNFGIDSYTDGFDPVQLNRKLANSHLTQRDLHLVVGGEFRNDLANLIVVSQILHPELSLLQTPAEDLDGRVAEAHKYSFADYIEKIMFPNINKVTGSVTTLALPELVAANSLKALTENLRSLPNLYIFENADDFLLDTGDLDYLQSLVPVERMYLYPKGGHCGNYWFEQNQKDLAEVMSSLL